MLRPATTALLFAAALLLGVAPAGADQLPRFASLSRDKAYLRQGPTYDHKVLWIYRHKGLPVEILASYDVWRRVKMPDGTVGWLHVQMLSSARTVLVLGKSPVPLRKDDDGSAKIIALAEPGVTAKLRHCGQTACEITADGTDGWADKSKLWGVRAGETF